MRTQAPCRCVVRRRRPPSRGAISGENRSYWRRCLGSRHRPARYGRPRPRCTICWRSAKIVGVLEGKAGRCLGRDRTGSCSRLRGEGGVTAFEWMGAMARPSTRPPCRPIRSRQRRWVNGRRSRCRSIDEARMPSSRLGRRCEVSPPNSVCRTNPESSYLPGPCPETRTRLVAPVARMAATATLALAWESR